MQKLDLLYEGRTKRIFASENPDEIIIAFLDNTTAYRGLKKSYIPGKGAVNNRISNHLMRKIAGLGIPTHFIKEITIMKHLSSRRILSPLPWLSGISRRVHSPSV